MFAQCETAKIAEIFFGSQKQATYDVCDATLE